MLSKLLNFFLFAVLVSSVNGGLVGGWSDIPCAEVSDEVQFASKSVVQATQTSVLHFVECVKAKKQVVAGFKYNLVLLFSIPNPVTPVGQKQRGLQKTVVYKVFLFRSLAGELSVTSFKEMIPEEDRILHKNKCMPGGRCDRAIDAKMIRVAKFAIQQMTKEEKNKKTFSLVKVLKAQTQVVNGLKIYLTLKLKVDGSDHKYNVEVYEDFNQNDTLVRYNEVGEEIIDGGFVGFGGHKPKAGGWHEVNMTEDFNKKLLYDASQFALQEIARQLTNVLQFVNAQNAYEQVVNGINLRFGLICTSPKGKTSFLVTVHVTPGNPKTRKFTLTSYKQLYLDHH